MRACRTPLLALVGLVALGPATSAAGAGGAAGGTPAPDGPSSGGAQFGAALGRPSAARPVAAVFRVAPRTLRAGDAPRIAVRIDQRGVRAVTARIVFRPVHGKGRTVTIALGQVGTGRLLHPAWPAGTSLAAGRYVVALHARGPAGATLLRRASASGRVPITVRKPKPKPKPKPAVAPAPPPLVAPPVAPVTPEPGVSAAGVFPVQGLHTYGGDDARFGAGRSGHIHQGQDVVAAEGVAVVAPLAGTIVARDHQADAAGYYLTLDASDGRSFFFAHCQKDSFAVTLGQAVAAGQPLCRVGSTGDASGPHLHFEIWIGGWRRSAASRPIDPLAQLQAWDH
jgi:murein DD-endopeptidase MepM/ murein hydrolase activator NlpD